MIALVVASVLFWLATRVDVYDATSPHALSHLVFGNVGQDVPHPWWLALHIWLRKFYSIVAFACVGLTAHQALNETSRPRLRAAIIVAVYSAGIEFAQYFVDPAEPFAERVLDVGCGAIGGWIGVITAQFAQRRRSGPQRVLRKG